MSTQQLQPRLHDVLQAINDFIEEYGSPPYRNNKWIANRLDQSGNNISNIKGELKKLGFLTDRTSFTPRGLEYARLFFGEFTVKQTEIRVQGYAKASPVEDDIQINYDIFDKPAEEILTIPNTFPDSDVFALKVNGPSMEKIGIFHGDFIIVEKKDNWWPAPNDMVVVKYLKHNEMREITEETDPASLLGPVVKIYLERSGEKGCKLGWYRNNESNPYMIVADEIVPIGKVIGVHKRIDRLVNLILQNT